MVFVGGLFSYKILTGLFGGPGFMALVRYERFIPPRMLARDTVCIKQTRSHRYQGKECNEPSSCAFLNWVVATQIWFWNFHPRKIWGKEVSHFDEHIFSKGLKLKPPT